MYYDAQSAGINMQSPQSESTLRRLTLPAMLLATNFHVYIQILSIFGTQMYNSEGIQNPDM
jgi:hypothetical protein